jgi:hypothetical protein
MPSLFNKAAGASPKDETVPPSWMLGCLELAERPVQRRSIRHCLSLSLSVVSIIIQFCQSIAIISVADMNPDCRHNRSYTLTRLANANMIVFYDLGARR